VVINQARSSTNVLKHGALGVCGHGDSGFPMIYIHQQLFNRCAYVEYHEMACIQSCHGAARSPWYHGRKNLHAYKGIEQHQERGEQINGWRSGHAQGSILIRFLDVCQTSTRSSTISTMVSSTGNKRWRFFRFISSAQTQTCAKKTLKSSFKLNVDRSAAYFRIHLARRCSHERTFVGDL